MIQQLRKLGLRQIYAVVRTADVAHGGPSWVLTVENDGDAEAINAALRPLVQNMQTGDIRMPVHFHAGSGVIVAAGDKSQLQATIENNAANGKVRASVRNAMNDLGGHGAGILIFGDADSRRVVRDMFPRLSGALSVIDGRLIADGLRWGGAAIDLPPSLQLSITIQADQRGTARVVKDLLSEVIEMGKAAAREQTDDSPEAANAAFIEALDLLRPEVDNAQVTIAIGSKPDEIATLVKVISAPVREARRAAERTQRMSKFKYIGLAMHNYAARAKSFPPAAITDGDGNRTLSWRVAILPYLDEKELYDQFRLDEPWDSPHNRELIARMPDVYADPNRAVRRAVGDGKTTFRRADRPPDGIPRRRGPDIQGHHRRHFEYGVDRGGRPPARRRLDATGGLGSRLCYALQRRFSRRRSPLSQSDSAMAALGSSILSTRGPKELAALSPAGRSPDDRALTASSCVAPSRAATRHTAQRNTTRIRNRS